MFELIPYATPRYSTLHEEAGTHAVLELAAGQLDDTGYRAFLQANMQLRANIEME